MKEKVAVLVRLDRCLDICTTFLDQSRSFCVMPWTDGLYEVSTKEEHGSTLKGLANLDAESCPRCGAEMVYEDETACGQRCSKCRAE